MEQKSDCDVDYFAGSATSHLLCAIQKIRALDSVRLSEADAAIANLLQEVEPQTFGCVSTERDRQGPQFPSPNSLSRLAICDCGVSAFAAKAPKESQARAPSARPSSGRVWRTEEEMNAVHYTEARNPASPNRPFTCPITVSEMAGRFPMRFPRP